MRVLLVEDEPNAAHVLAKGLREQAYAVDVAADGERGDLSGRRRPTTTPSSSTSCCRSRTASRCAARSVRPASPVPILMVTARDAGGRAHRGARLRRRRLPGQAVRLRRAARAAARARSAAAGSRSLPERLVGRPARRSTPASRRAWVREPRGVADREGIRAARVSRAARAATSSAAATSPSTSGTNTTIRCRTSSTSTCSGCGAEARSTGSTSMHSHAPRRGLSGCRRTPDSEAMADASLRARLTRSVTRRRSSASCWPLRRPTSFWGLRRIGCAPDRDSPTLDGLAQRSLRATNCGSG